MRDLAGLVGEGAVACPLSLPFSAGSSPCFLPVGGAQPVQTTQDADVLNKSSSCHLLSGVLGVLGLGWGQAQVLLPAPTEISRSPQISLSARPALEGSNPRVGWKRSWGCAAPPQYWAHCSHHTADPPTAPTSLSSHKQH